MIDHQNEIDDVAATETGVYWAAGADGVLAADPTGSGRRHLASGQDTSLAVTANSTHVFWIDYDLRNNQQVVRAAAAQGGLPTELLAMPGYVFRLTADTGNAYVAFARTDMGGPTPSGAIIQVPLAGTGAMTLASAQAWPDDVAVTDSDVYWLTIGACDTDCLDGALWRVPIAGGPITQLATALHAAGSFLVLPTGFYILGAGVGAADGGRVPTIYWCPPSGCGDGNRNLTVIVSQPGIRAIASDGTSLFWLVSGTGEPTLGSGDGSIARMSLVSGEKRDVVRGLPPAWRLSVNRSNIYWVTNSVQGVDAVAGTLMTVPNGD
jgi:hypothetical protein